MKFQNYINEAAYKNKWSELPSTIKSEIIKTINNLTDNNSKMSIIMKELINNFKIDQGLASWIVGAHSTLRLI